MTLHACIEQRKQVPLKWVHPFFLENCTTVRPHIDRQNLQTSSFISGEKYVKRIVIHEMTRKVTSLVCYRTSVLILLKLNKTVIPLQTLTQFTALLNNATRTELNLSVVLYSVPL